MRSKKYSDKQDYAQTGNFNHISKEKKGIFKYNPQRFLSSYFSITIVNILFRIYVDSNRNLGQMYW